MYPLVGRDRERVLPLYAPISYNLSIASIVSGNTRGWVYVDDPGAPRAALLWSEVDALLLAGDRHDPALRADVGQLIAHTLVPEIASRYIRDVMVYYTPEAWADYRDEILPGLNARQEFHRAYRPGPLRLDPRANLPAGWSLAPITAALLAQRSLGNIEEVEGWVLSFWRSIEDFERLGLGYALRVDGAIASWCLSVYVAGNAYELGLATAPAYRNRGCATRVAAACLAQGHAQGRTPHWHCGDDNLASAAVAEKVGFIDPVRYPVLHFAVRLPGQD
jgi:RimJ/RimL family protein N-acetyltransferase